MIRPDIFCGDKGCEPWFWHCPKGECLAAPDKQYLLCMESLMRQQQLTLLVRGQLPFNKSQITGFIRAVELVSHDWMSHVGQMNPDLMFPACEWHKSQQGELAFRPCEPLLDAELCLCRCAIRAHAILDGNGTAVVPAYWDIDQTVFIAHMAVDNGQITLGNGAGFPEFAQLSCHLGALGHHDDAAGFAIQPVDQSGLHALAKIESRTADQTGHFAALCRMTNQSRRFVDHQQLGIFKDYLEQLAHVAHRRFPKTSRLVILLRPGMLLCVTRKMAMPLVLMVVFALSRIPGMLPENFSAAYALAFCAGVYLPGRIGWWFPLGALVITDLGLNFYYSHCLGLSVWELATLKSQLFNYVAYGLLIWLGRRFKPGDSFARLLGGGLLGSILFYLVTNTASWFFNPFGNPEYSKTLIGWLIALTKGTAGWPPTWEFFRNTLLSGGLFTGLFVGAMKFREAAESPREKEAGAENEETEAEPEPEETQA